MADRSLSARLSTPLRRHDSVNRRADRVFSDIPVLMAKALAGVISVEGAGEALSIGASGFLLRPLGGNPMDVHLHTSINLRRYLLRLDGISLKNKLMLLPTC